MTTNQEGVHLAVRDITGTALSYNEDWHALFDAEGITAGTFNERMLGWINATLSASYTNVNEAMQAFAVEQGFANWASMNTFVAGSEAATFLRTYGPYGMVLDFSDASIAIKEASGVLDFTSQGQVSNGLPVGPGAKLTYSAPSAKLTEQSDGFLKFQAHNLALWSEDFSNAAWNKSNVTVSGTVATATGAASNKFIRQLNLVSGGPSYSIQFDVAAGTHSLVQIYTDTPTTAYANFDLANGVLGTVGAGATASIELVSGTTYRCTAVFASTGTNARLSFVDSTSAAWNATSASTGTISVTRAHFRRTPSQSDYIATTTAAAYDLPYVYSSGALQGIMVEPAATNLALRSVEFDNASWVKSETTVTANAAIAPDGTQTADKIVESVAAASRYVGQSVTTTAAAHTFSMYLKQSERRYVLLYHAQTTAGRVFDLQTGTLGGTAGLPAPTTSNITALPNGWYRCDITVTATAASNSFRAYPLPDGSTLSYTGDGTSGVFVWGAQLETGTVATSPIITYGSTVLRAADNISMATSLFPLGTDMSAFIDAVPINADIGTQFSIGTVSSGDTVGLYVVGRSALAFIYDTTTQANMGVGSFSAGVRYKVAFRSVTNNFAACMDGGAIVPDTSGTAPTLTAPLKLGGNEFGGSFGMLIIKRIMVKPSAWSNAELQAVTA